MSRITRRQFLTRSVTVAATVGAAPLVAACTATRRAAPRPGPVPAGAEPEAGPLKLLDWEQHISKDALTSFARVQATDWEYVSFFNTDEQIERMTDEPFDVTVVSVSRLPVLIDGGLVQPLSGKHLTNTGNVWPEALDGLGIDPAFAMPYTVGKAGIGWWPDRVGGDTISRLDDPTDVFWIEEFRNAAALPSGYAEGIALGLRRAGVKDLSTGDPDDIERAKQELLLTTASIELEDPATWLAWSGDVVNRRADKDGPRFSFGPAPLLAADAFVIPSRAPHPVLAHSFIDHMLNPDVAYENSLWLGYRQPVSFGLTYGSDAGPGYATPSDIREGSLYGPQDDASDALWRQTWDEVISALR